jgi:hypothetical protein
MNRTVVSQPNLLFAFPLALGRTRWARRLGRHGQFVEALPAPPAFALLERGRDKREAQLRLEALPCGPRRTGRRHCVRARCALGLVIASSLH